MILKFPKNARVLRAYGSFLEDIKNDVELAQIAFRNADEIEEEKARQHKNHKKSFMKKQRTPAQTQAPALPLENNFVQSSEEDLPSSDELV